MTTTIERLRELAEAATPGPWQESDGTVFMSGSAYFEVAENATQADSSSAPHNSQKGPALVVTMRCLHAGVPRAVVSAGFAAGDCLRRLDRRAPGYPVRIGLHQGPETRPARYPAYLAGGEAVKVTHEQAREVVSQICDWGDVMDDTASPAASPRPR